MGGAPVGWSAGWAMWGGCWGGWDRVVAVDLSEPLEPPAPPAPGPPPPPTLPLPEPPPPLPIRRALRWLASLSLPLWAGDADFRSTFF